MRIGIVAGVFAADIVDEMVRLCERTVRAEGHEVAAVVRVPGAFDTPLPVARLLLDDGIDGVVVVGTIITGETKHDEVIAHATARTLQDLSVRHDKPVGFAITGPCPSHTHAKGRIDAAAHAVKAVLASRTAPRKRS